MFNFEALIGIDEPEARKLLIDSGYNKINTINNDKNNNKTNTQIVCKASYDGDCVTLICGDFITNFKEI